MKTNSHQEKTYTILELNTEIERVLEGSFTGLIWVRGEITGFDKQKNQKNIFFQLQEKNPNKDQIISKISATIFNSDIKKILQKFSQISNTELRDGLEIRALCRIDVYPPWGEYKMVIKDIDPEFTLGKLAQTRAMIIEDLKNKGLLDKNKQLILSLVPQFIGFITQKGREGYTDFLSKLKDSGLSFRVRFYNSSVQGEKVESEICEALDYFHQKKNVDVIVIVRGGGAKTDLSWFDNKKIAERIAHMPVPVVTGIGHRTDLTITDMVAFSSQQTPSIAATFLIDRVNEFIKNIDSLAVEINHNSEVFIKSEMQSLKEVKTQIIRESLLFLEKNKEQLKENYNNLVLYCKELLRNTRETIKSYLSNIDFLDPINTVRRGFSISKINGKTIKSIKDARIDQNMITTVSDGEIKSIINQ